MRVLVATGPTVAEDAVTTLDIINGIHARQGWDASLRHSAAADGAAAAAAAFGAAGAAAAAAAAAVATGAAADAAAAAAIGAVD